MRRLVALLCTTCLGVVSAFGQAPGRPMIVEDLFGLSEIDGITLAPDGERIAATITRPGMPNGCPTCNYKASGDVWVIDARTGERKNLTNGASDGSSSWLPVWSPDGRRLAFVSTRAEAGDRPGGDDIRLYVWDSASSAVTRMANRGVCLQVDCRAGAASGPLAWIDATHLLAAFLREGQPGAFEMLYWRRAIAEGRKAWAKYDERAEPTASVLESGGAPATPGSVSLQVVDVVDRATRTVVEVPKWDLWDLGLGAQVVVSPDARRIAVLGVTGTIRLDRARAISDAIRTYRAGIVSLEAGATPLWASLDAKREHADGQLLSWSPAGDEIALTERAEPGARDPTRLVLAISARDGTVRDATPSGFTTGAVGWGADGRIVARPRRGPGGAASAPAAEVTPPTATATLVEERGGRRVFRDDAADGTSLWATDGAGRSAARLITLNGHVATIAEGERRLIEYRSVDGKTLLGLAILPPGFEAGKRYPVATWVYGGLVLRDARTPLASKTSTRPLNLELLAGHGYVVLIPSVPLPPFGTRGDPWLDIPKGVMPCVDRLVELGIADPERLAVLGHSTGGYSTYSVVTYTNRFKAAVALSGHPDLISLHGQFFPGERFHDRVNEGLATVGFTEYGPMSLGGPPSEDLWRYLRNSPIFYFDRVQTPLLIVHGEMDGAPVQQGEEAFTSLYRLGKRARFVRYWGEGHVIASPPNVRHLWAQIFEWLDGNLGAPTPK